MKVFVTGATGVVGRRLLPLLVRAGHEVTAIVRSPNKRAELESWGIRTVDVDLFDPPGVQRAVAGHDVVVNLATHIPHGSLQMLLPWAWHENDRVRRLASAILVDACLATNVPQLIQESFAPAYPDCGDQWIPETMPLKPPGYSRTVLDAEAATERFSQRGRIGIVLRFGAFYGPDAAQTMAMIDSVQRGWVVMPGPRTAYLSSISHDDAATAVAAALALPAGIYNVVDDEPVTHAAYVESLADALDVAPPRFLPSWLTPLLGTVGELLSRSVRISNRKLRSASGWAPAAASVREGWPRVIAGTARVTPPAAPPPERPRATDREPTPASR